MHPILLSIVNCRETKLSVEIMKRKLQYDNEGMRDLTRKGKVVQKDQGDTRQIVVYGTMIV